MRALDKISFIRVFVSDLPLEILPFLRADGT